MLDAEDVVWSVDDAFIEQEAGREFGVGAGCSHRHRNAFVVAPWASNLDFQRLLDGKAILALESPARTVHACNRCVTDLGVLIGLDTHMEIDSKGAAGVSR